MSCVALRRPIALASKSSLALLSPEHRERCVFPARRSCRIRGCWRRSSICGARTSPPPRGARGGATRRTTSRPHASTTQRCTAVSTLSKRINSLVSFGLGFGKPPTRKQNQQQQQDWLLECLQRGRAHPPVGYIRTASIGLTSSILLVGVSQGTAALPLRPPCGLIPLPRPWSPPPPPPPSSPPSPVGRRSSARASGAKGVVRQAPRGRWRVQTRARLQRR